MYCTITYMIGHGLGDLTFVNIKEFEWDEGNIIKNRVKHNVEPSESEQIFHDRPIYFFDEKHSQREERYLAYGITDMRRGLCIAFTIRNDLIRVISARDLHKKERRIYEKYQTNPEV